MDYRDPDWVAERLGVDKNTVYRFLQDGTLPALQLGRKWLISERRLLEWLEQETDKQTRARRDAVNSAEGVVRRMENYTAAARQVLKLAHGAARGYAHERLDSGHLLLGILLEGHSHAADALARLGIGVGQVRSQIERRSPPGAGEVPRRLSRTDDAKRAMRIASRLAHKDAPRGGGVLDVVGVDHLLLGIYLARQGTGHAILRESGVTRKRLRKTLRAKPDDSGGGAEPLTEN